MKNYKVGDMLTYRYDNYTATCVIYDIDYYEDEDEVGFEPPIKQVTLYAFSVEEYLVIDTVESDRWSAVIKNVFDDIPK